MAEAKKDPTKKNRAEGILEAAQEAIAAAKENGLKKRLYDALVNSTPDDLVGANDEAEVLKGNTLPSTCWIHAPAMVQLLAAAQRRLVRIASQSGMVVNQVKRVHAHLLKGTKILVIKAADKDDLSAYEITRRGSAAYFNLIDLLGEANLTVETGYRVRFDVAYAPKESKLWPALVVDLGDAKERDREPDASEQAGSAKKGKTKKPDNTRGETGG